MLSPSRLVCSKQTSRMTRSNHTKGMRAIIAQHNRTIHRRIVEHERVVNSNGAIAPTRAAASSTHHVRGIQALNSKRAMEVMTSSNLKDYLEKYWIVVFGLDTISTGGGGGVGNNSHSHTLSEIRRHLAWYGGRHKVVTLDRHPHAKALVQQIADWRRREELAADQEQIRRAMQIRGGRNAHDNTTGTDEGGGSSSSSSSSLSLEPTATRHLYSRSNLTEFGRLFMSPSPVPAVFVNQHYLGGLEDLQLLEKQKKLKDIIQFGFEWKTNKFLEPLAPRYDDKALFKGAYVGAPVMKPVAMLPQISTRFNVDDPYEG